MDEETSLLKIEKDLGNNTTVVVCPNCDAIEYCESKELETSYKLCDKCYYVFPCFSALTNYNPLDITIKNFNLDVDKVKAYKKFRLSELLSFHTHEDGAS